MKKNLIHHRTGVTNINCHVVWSVKYRRKILNEETEDFLKQNLAETASEKGFVVHMIECGNKDHVHCLISVPSSMPVSKTIQYMKRRSSIFLMKSFPWIKNCLWGGHIWNPSNYIETIGCISEDVIRKYIYQQNKK